MVYIYIYMLTKLGYIDGKCDTIYGIHTDPMGYTIIFSYKASEFDPLNVGHRSFCMLRWSFDRRAWPRPLNKNFTGEDAAHDFWVEPTTTGGRITSFVILWVFLGRRDTQQFFT